MSSRIFVDSDFDSGNGMFVSSQKLGPRSFEYVVRTVTDCHGTPYNCSNLRSWYHFRVLGAETGDTIRFVVRNTTRLARLYNQGHKPVFRIGEDGDWAKIPGTLRTRTDPPAPGTHNRRFVITFTHNVFSSSGEPVYFAFSYPFSYTELQNKIEGLEETFDQHPSIYFHRDVITHTLEGRNLDVLTVSSRRHMIPMNRRDRENGVVIAEGLEGMTARRFTDSKMTYLLTSRIHCGETPSSHISNGFLDFILSDSPRASLLRDRFVFKFIPMLNPDGVANGHWRYHMLGHELNGCFWDPELGEQPTIYATRHLIDHLWSFENLKFYVDLHAHVNKKNAFIFGNCCEDLNEQFRNILYAKLVSLHSSEVDFERCNFSYKRMENFTGTGRVVMYTENGMVHSYTLEVNFNSGDKIGEESRNVFYGLDHFRNVGRGLALALLDFYYIDPASSILPSTHFRSMRNLIGHLRQRMKRSVRLWRGTAKQIVEYSFEGIREQLLVVCDQIRGFEELSPLGRKELIARLIVRERANRGRIEAALREIGEERRRRREEEEEEEDV